MIEGRLANSEGMAVEREVAVEGDTESFYLVRKRNDGASDVDARERWIMVQSLPRAESDCFRLVVMTEPGMEGGKTEFKSG